MDFVSPPLGTEMVFSCSKCSPSFSTAISRTPSPCRTSGRARIITEYGPNKLEQAAKQYWDSIKKE